MTVVCAKRTQNLNSHTLKTTPILITTNGAVYTVLSQTKLRSVKLIIVDEISMVSSLMLMYMHLRLEEQFGGDEWFGCS